MITPRIWISRNNRAPSPGPLSLVRQVPASQQPTSRSLNILSPTRSLTDRSLTGLVE